MPSVMTKWKVKMSSNQKTSPIQRVTFDIGKLKSKIANSKIPKLIKPCKRKSVSPPKPTKTKSESGDEKVCEVDPPVLEKYKIIERIGKGAYGIVWDAIDLKTKKKIALKKIFDAFRNNMDAQRTYREIFFLIQFGSHPNIINLTGGYQAQNDLDFYLCFPLMITDLHKVVKTNPEKLGNKEIRAIFYQISKAILYIHSANVIHRDLKPANVLLDKYFNVKLGDFGLARSLNFSDWGNGDSHPEMTDYVATRWYRPPEILLSCRRYSKSMDIWGLGCILGEMVNKRAIFPGANTIEQIELVIGTIEQPTRDELERITTSASLHSVVLAAMMCRKPSVGEIFESQGPHVVDFLEKILLFVPERRLTIEQVLEHPLLKWNRSVWEEIRFDRTIAPPIDEMVRFPLDTYRSLLYTMLENGEIGSRNKKSLSAGQHLPFEKAEDVAKNRAVPGHPIKLMELEEGGGGGDTWELPVRITDDEKLHRQDAGNGNWSSGLPFPPIQESSDSDSVPLTKTAKQDSSEQEEQQEEPKPYRSKRTKVSGTQKASKIQSTQLFPSRNVMRRVVTPPRRIQTPESVQRAPKQKQSSRYLEPQSQAQFQGLVNASRIDVEAIGGGDPHPTEFDLNLHEMEVRLKEMDLKDPEKGEDWNLKSMKPPTGQKYWPGQETRRPSTAFRSITESIIQSLYKYPQKKLAPMPEQFQPQTLQPSTSVDSLTFVDERPIRSRGKKASTVATGNHDSNERYENHFSREESDPRHYVDERASRSKRYNRIPLETTSVSFNPTTEKDFLGKWIDSTGQRSSKPSNQIGFAKPGRIHAEREREKMKHSAYFPIAEFDNYSSFKHPTEMIKLTMPKVTYGKEYQRNMISSSGNLKINDEKNFGLIRQEPIQIRKRAGTRPRPTTQPLPTNKTSLRFKNRLESLPTVIDSVTRPTNYGTISSKDLNDLKATFSHVGRY